MKKNYLSQIDFISYTCKDRMAGPYFSPSNSRPLSLAGSGSW